MMYKVVTGRITDTYGYQKIHFQSKDVNDCFQFISSRMNSQVKAVRNTSRGMTVVDPFGETVSMSAMKKNA